MYEVGVARTFEALHQLEPGGEGGAEPAPHDHSHDYRVEAVVRGEELAENGMLLDLDHLGAALSECLAELDDSNLDALAVFAGHSTTVEVVAAHIWDHVAAALRASPGVVGLRVRVFESADAWASLDRDLER